MSSLPLDMIIERRLYDAYQPLRPSQLASLHAMYLDSLPALTDREIKRLANELIGTKGVKHGKLMMTTTSKGLG